MRNNGGTWRHPTVNQPLIIAIWGSSGLWTKRRKCPMKFCSIFSQTTKETAIFQGRGKTNSFGWLESPRAPICRGIIRKVIRMLPYSFYNWDIPRKKKNNNKRRKKWMFRELCRFIFCFWSDPDEMIQFKIVGRVFIFKRVLNRD